MEPWPDEWLTACDNLDEGSFFADPASPWTCSAALVDLAVCGVMSAFDEFDPTRAEPWVRVARFRFPRLCRAGVPVRLRVRPPEREHGESVVEVQVLREDDEVCAGWLWLPETPRPCLAPKAGRHTGDRLVR